MRSKKVLRRIQGRLRRLYKLLPSKRQRVTGWRYLNRRPPTWLERRLDKKMLQVNSPRLLNLL